MLFAHAAEQGRVFVTCDRPAEAIAIRWLREGRGFKGMISCPSEGMTVGEVVVAFDVLADQEGPFGSYPIVCISTKSTGSGKP